MIARRIGESGRSIAEKEERAVLLIVNADDLGTSEAINDKTFALMERGLVTSATVMSNAPAFEHAVRRMGKYPRCSFGVHLNLTTFPPLKPSAAMDGILDGEGRLSMKVFDASLSGDLSKVVKAELFAQVQKAFDAGVPVSHLDSHLHIHTWPRLFFVLKALQRHFGIRKVRSTVNILPPGQRLALPRALKKKLFLFALRRIGRTRSPDGLGDFLDYYRALEAGSPPRLRALELMVHPGIVNERFEEEIRLLESEDWPKRLGGRAELGSYHAL